MVNYSSAKIYSIRSFQSDQIYIGSTTTSLNVRLAHHRKDYKRYLNGNFSYMTSFELIKLDDCYIELIEEFPCQNREQLHKKEGEHIRKTPNCVNRRIAGRTGTEYRQDNADKCNQRSKQYRQDNPDYNKQYYENNKQSRKQQMKQWRQDNKEHVRDYQKQPYTCECGAVIWLNSKSRHLKTKKHIDYTSESSTISSIEGMTRALTI